MSDKNFMNMCFDLAQKSWGEVSPNPYVGAVIVKDGEIVSTGYHKGPGLAHAELDAINNADQDLEGATIFCNLEPCCHTNKRTPPCAQRIIKEKFKKVVIANLDPNPLVAGNGVKLMQEAGIEVVNGVLKEKGELLNEVFFKHIQKELPFVHLKWAQTLDGKIAAKNYTSKWITSDRARAHVHHERMAHDAILVGASTVKKDNPSLTVREGDKVVKSIKRIVVASKDDFDKGLKFFSDHHCSDSILVLPEGVQTEANVEVVNCKTNDNGKIDLIDMLKKLHQLGIYSVYVEGGHAILTQFLKEKIYDRVSVFIAPKIIGEGLSPLGDIGIHDMKDALCLLDSKVELLGDNIYLTSRGGACSQD
ncbi:MAG: bifunctional diaminohydroxyphosphoribosylaminopyrimidine deaminase/5-amino-6-(5-phosphoribosylamino)uracil reductase RibD [Bacteriovoracaceae bacterium]|nr:bifunctional diaminohydroxyphosphoribosylaminopyrimidine deaminase/5-amino-6-(5-phosphoribosylamino)uracil reductase RibD [Bacteriovoracaceae bacterium]